MLTRTLRSVPYVRRPFYVIDQLSGNLAETHGRLIASVAEKAAMQAEKEALIEEVAALSGKATDLEKELFASKSEAAEREKALMALVSAVESERDLMASKSPQLGEIYRGIEQLLSWSNPRTDDLYLDLVEAELTGILREDPSIDPWTEGFDASRRAIGRDWPATAETMIGGARMRNIRDLLQEAIKNNIPGDVIETGVWRGGACIYMRAILAAAGDTSRRVFVADSFKGLPEPSGEYEDDAGDAHSTYAALSVSREQVETNFKRYGLLDDRVVFLEGWFKDTLPTAPIEKLAILRLDGDMYESTIQALDALYDKVSPGGYVIVDDYILKPCAKAVDDFRASRGIDSPLVDVDGAAVWWQVK